MACEATVRNLLERMLLDTSIEATNLPISLLKSITNNFSDDHQIGEGGFAAVYKGTLQNGAVAVKKLSQKLDVPEDKFLQEVDNMLRVKHENIVRFLGYCSDTQGIVQKFEGRNVMAEERQRLLCFEFLPLGSLDKHISDASGGLQWVTRYQIIRGICEGLQYLHQQKIVHLDLKPANILLDHNMVAKIADFGISRCFDKAQSRAVTLNPCGSLGYMAPEYITWGEITLRSDIYSLGVIILEIVAGRNGCPVIDNVLESWSTRFEASKGDIRLEPIQVCAEIGIKCTDFNPVNRPDIQHIIKRLDEMEHACGVFVPDRCTLSETQICYHNGPSMDSKLLDIYPLELRFAFVPDEVIDCPLTLTNRTDHTVAVCITPICQDPCLHPWHPVPLLGTSVSLEDDPCITVFEIMGPRCTRVVPMVMKKQQQKPPDDTCMFEVVMIINPPSMEQLKSTTGRKLNLDMAFMKTVSMLGLGTEQVHRAVLKTIVCDPASCYEVICDQKFINRRSLIGRTTDIISCIDVHPSQTWILVGSTYDDVFIFNYKTQKKMRRFKVTSCVDPAQYRGSVETAKFISQEEWLAVGDFYGWVHVYAYNNAEDPVKEFKAHDNCIGALAIHPTYPYMLTSCDRNDEWIKLWDWAQGWQCIRKFDNITLPEVITWKTRDANTFAAVAHEDGLKVWNIHYSSLDSIVKELEGNFENCCFYRDGNQNFVATSIRVLPRDTFISTDIWDEKGDLVHRLHLRKQEERNSYLTKEIVCHPTLPILVTRCGRTLCFWDACTYRLEKILQLAEEPIRKGGMTFINTNVGLPRLVVGCEKGIAIIEIDLPALKTDVETAAES